MSEPKRYDLVDKHYGYFLCHKIEGEWVKWEDYVRLKAEVERLTKAGDAMAKEWVNCESLYHGNEDFIEAWNAAKGGKQP